MPNLSGTVVENSDLNALPFPGRIIERDDPDTNIVRALQHRLNEVGCGPIDEDGVWRPDRKRCPTIPSALFRLR